MQQPVQFTAEVASFEVDTNRAVEVFTDQYGEHWVGMTIVRNPRDWEFHPREQYGTGEGGRQLATAAAQSWRNGIVADARFRA